MRQFVCAAPPDSKGLVEVSGKDFHYLKNVLRLKVGDMANLAVPGGGAREATVCKIDGAAKKMLLQVCGGAERNGGNSNGESAPPFPRRSRLALLQFVPKPQKMELIVRQAAECGVQNIVPVIGEYTQGGNERPLQKPERFERIIREARQQSGSRVETKLFSPLPLSAALDLLDRPGFFAGADFEKNEGAAQDEKAPANEGAANGQERAEIEGFAREKDGLPFAKIFFYERGENTLSLADALFGEGFGAAQGKCGGASERSDDLNPRFRLPDAFGRRPRFCAFAVGSEGGISPAERDALLADGFKAVHFNTNILRCETAALYAAAAIQSALDN